MHLVKDLVDVFGGSVAAVHFDHASDQRHDRRALGKSDGMDAHGVAGVISRDGDHFFQTGARRNEPHVRCRHAGEFSVRAQDLRQNGLGRISPDAVIAKGVHEKDGNDGGLLRKKIKEFMVLVLHERAHLVDLVFLVVRKFFKVIERNVVGQAIALPAFEAIEQLIKDELEQHVFPDARQPPHLHAGIPLAQKFVGEHPDKVAGHLGAFPAEIHLRRFAEHLQCALPESACFFARIDLVEDIIGKFARLPADDIRDLGTGVILFFRLVGDVLFFARHNAFYGVFGRRDLLLPGKRRPFHIRKQRIPQLTQSRRTVGKGVDPVFARQIVTIFVGKRHLLDLTGDDRLFGVERQLDLIAHMSGNIGMMGSEQDKCAAPADRRYDLRRIIAAGEHIPRSDPAAEPGPFQIITHIAGYIAVIGRITDKYKRFGSCTGSHFSVLPIFHISFLFCPNGHPARFVSRCVSKTGRAAIPRTFPTVLRSCIPPQADYHGCNG